jgi:hypothetical protein
MPVLENPRRYVSGCEAVFGVRIVDKADLVSTDYAARNPPLEAARI